MKRAPPRPHSPRERARARLEALSRGAALTVSAAIAPVCAACDPLPPPPPPQTACTPADDVSLWMSASAFNNGDGTLTFTITLNVGFSGTQLATAFAAAGASIVGAPQFDAASLATSTNVALSLQPAIGANDITVQTGVTCDGAARAVRFAFTLDEVNQNGSAFPPAQEIP